MPTLQYLAVAALLYVEVAVTLLLAVPFIKPWIWRKVFGLFRFLAPFKMYLNFLYVGALGVLILLFLDSIREMNKFGKVAGEKFVQHEQELDRHMKMFRSQRNFYIVGFALFLFVVIRRLSVLISTVAKLEASNAALERQGRNTSEQLLRTMSTEDKSKTKKTDSSTSKSSVKTGPSQEEYDALKDELEKAQKNLAAMKRQSESTAAEYDRLSSEYQKLQQKIEEDEAKKDK